MASASEQKHIDEWTCDELQAWIETLNMKPRSKKRLKKAIAEQEITGQDINSVESVKDIQESFPEITSDSNSAKKLFNSLQNIRENQTTHNNNDNTSVDDTKQNNVMTFSEGEAIYCLDNINKKWHPARIKKVKENGVVIEWEIMKWKASKYDEFVASKQYNIKIKLKTTEWRRQQMNDWDCNQLIEWVICINLTAENEDKMIECIAENEICGADMHSLQDMNDINESFGGIDKQTARKLYHQLQRARNCGVNQPFVPNEELINQQIDNQNNEKAFEELKSGGNENENENDKSEENENEISGAGGGTGADVVVGECVVCMDEKRNHIIIPCGHICICGECKKEYEKDKNAKCPVCRGEIQSIIKAYF